MRPLTRCKGSGIFVGFFRNSPPEELSEETYQKLTRLSKQLGLDLRHTMVRVASFAVKRSKEDCRFRAKLLAAVRADRRRRPD